VLLVFGPRSTTYDFGPGHPLTPRRFGPGIDLLRAVGAEPGLAPEPAPDDELRWCHARRYIEVVKRFSDDPHGWADSGWGEAGIGEGGDDPPFTGMHEAGAAVAGGSLRAIEAVLRGDVEHAFHPGGGLHHAMRDHASGFCIYNDVALAIARARRDGLRVLYLDFDVHHGDGVQAIHGDDSGVLTFSIHESGRYLFPGTGFAGELGEGAAAGTVVNLPLEPSTGERAWWPAVATLVPELAAAFGPDVVVSQHGADSHAWDPLAHLRMTTTAMGEAARLVDAVAHRHAGGRWLATGGGGYDAYRVVPRSWSLVWLAGAHRAVPNRTPEAWRDRWAAEGARYGQSPPPEAFTDPANAGEPYDGGQALAESRSTATVALVRRVVVPRLLRVARDRGWWSPLEARVSRGSRGDRDADGVPSGEGGEPHILADVDAGTWARLTLATGVIAPTDPSEAHALVAMGLRDGLVASVAVDGATVVGAVLSRLANPDSRRADLLALGVAAATRRQGLAGRLLAAHLDALPAGIDVAAEVTAAERDPSDPLDGALRRTVARRVLEASGFVVVPAESAVRSADPASLSAVRPGRASAGR
jgi:acetoin utilization protein AcuC